MKALFSDDRYTSPKTNGYQGAWKPESKRLHIDPPIEVTLCLFDIQEMSNTLVDTPRLSTAQ